ncbi:putative nicotinate-nucleotide adenylyltransferase NadD [Magnetospirillum sp. XM-1]|uniref:nicotinate-nucleotide adenylyltransferase n=1 Tax=Magnetospirillum sp. XM-1 TaxID=1663591 RepID=UPI00073DCF74|nr:nicotinate-nucleotide adenylyltransferase [Magnetospirillum sp. XM-1]CUW37367.1 putative nicotinate-nucleotide adenylyltransferase NadD [Magnetospirillum sp. XM-1]
MTRPRLNPWGETRRARVGLLGGSFNPAHDGHRHIALLALKLLSLDEIWLLVSPQNPLKPVAGMAPLAKRLASAETVCAGHPRLRPTDIETRWGTSYTADTLALLRLRFPRIRFVWLMGADNLAGFHRWARWESIFRAVPVAILARGPYSARTLGSRAAHRFAQSRQPSSRARFLWQGQPPAWAFLHTRRHAASSTAIRNRRQP